MPMPLPFLLAATPPPPAAVPPRPRRPAQRPRPTQEFVPTTPLLEHGGKPARQAGGALGPVETFDPIGRALLIAERIPRLWSGAYRDFSQPAAVPVNLVIDTATAEGQMVNLRGSMTIGGVVTAVQGNLNAKSDQLDLLLLADELGGGLEPGGEFQGLQGISLSGWSAPRLTALGGRLQLLPARAGASSAGPTIRGLW